MKIQDIVRLSGKDAGVRDLLKKMYPDLSISLDHDMESRSFVVRVQSIELYDGKRFFIEYRIPHIELIHWREERGILASIEIAVELFREGLRRATNGEPSRVRMQMPSPSGNRILPGQGVSRAHGNEEGRQGG